MIIEKTFKIKFGDEDFPHVLKVELEQGHISYIEICGRDGECVTMDEDEAKGFIEALHLIKTGDL